MYAEKFELLEAKIRETAMLVSRLREEKRQLEGENEQLRARIAELEEHLQRSQGVEERYVPSLDKALFTANDDAIAGVEGDGVVTARRPGETAIMVRYLGQVAVSRVAVLPPWKLPRSPKLAQNNFIDRLVQAKLEKMRVVLSGLCTDAEFIRRATLDTCGIIPTVDEVQRFVADPSPDKRAKLIDQLLDRPEFVDLWTLKWNDALRNNPRFTREGALPYSNWIREQAQKNRPFDQFVRDLLTATARMRTSKSTRRTCRRRSSSSLRNGRGPRR